MPIKPPPVTTDVMNKSNHLDVVTVGEDKKAVENFLTCSGCFNGFTSLLEFAFLQKLSDIGKSALTGCWPYH